MECMDCAVWLSFCFFVGLDACVDRGYCEGRLHDPLILLYILYVVELDQRAGRSRFQFLIP